MSDRMYTAEVLADSLSPEGHRLTTVKVIYPHAVHKDMLRHRCMNRNVESFRAQPPEVLIANLRNGHAFKPDVFAKRTQGMGQSIEEVQGAEVASQMWDTHVLKTCALAEEFIKMDVAKQQVNFLLQDLCPLTEIITATDWSNFYALRLELRDDGTPVARPEVYKTAKAIKDAIDASMPQELKHDRLHLPMITEEELAEIRHRRRLGYPDGYYEIEGYWYRVSAGRCARISYGDFDWHSEPREVSYARAEKLLTAGHMSPFEQQAKPFSEKRWNALAGIQSQIAASELPQHEIDDMLRQSEYSGNLHGWIPARKTFAGEHDYGILKALAKT